MTLRTTAAALAAIAILAVPATATAGKRVKSPVREFTGTVTSVKGKTFKLRRGSRAPLKLTISRKSRVAKGANPRKGRQLVVKARRVKKAWVVRSVRLVPVAAGDDEFEPGDDDPVGDLDEEDVPEEAGDDGGDSDLDLEETFEDVLPE